MPPFVGTRKPYRQRDRCNECLHAPHAAGLRAAGRYVTPKPFHTAPLFAALRPGSQTPEENR